MSRLKGPETKSPSVSDFNLLAVLALRHICELSSESTNHSLLDIDTSFPMFLQRVFVALSLLVALAMAAASPSQISCQCAFKDDGSVSLSAHLESIPNPTFGDRNWIVIAEPGAACDAVAAFSVPPSHILLLFFCPPSFCLGLIPLSFTFC